VVGRLCVGDCPGQAGTVCVCVLEEWLLWSEEDKGQRRLVTEIELTVSDYQSHVQMMRSEVMDEVDWRMSGSR
jgi:hypothetical protein